MSSVKKSLICSLFLSMLIHMPSAHAGLLASTKNFFWGDNQSATSSAFRIATASAMVAGSAWGIYKLNTMAQQKDFDKEYPKTAASLRLGVKIAKPVVSLVGLYVLIKTLENNQYVKPRTTKNSLTYLLSYVPTLYITMHITIYFLNNVINKPEKVVDDLTPFIPKESFKDYAGEIPKEITDLVDYLTNPKVREKYKAFPSLQPCKGFLFWGPPGTGKTALARALAGQAKTPFFHIKASDLASCYYGETVRLIASNFKNSQAHAAKQENGCVILFFDEIDAIAPNRNQIRGDDKHHRTEIIDSFLEELDGCQSRDGVIVLASTNRIHELDPAFLRPGRIDKTIYMALPSEKEQAATLKLYLKKYNYVHKDNEEKMNVLCEKIYHKLNCTLTADGAKEPIILGSHRASKADIKLLVEDAARNAVHNDAAPVLCDIDIEGQAERVNKELVKKLQEEYGHNHPPSTTTQ